jgi:hypothetical protein
MDYESEFEALTDAWVIVVRALESADLPGPREFLEGAKKHLDRRLKNLFGERFREPVPNPCMNQTQAGVSGADYTSPFCLYLNHGLTPNR